MDALNMVDVFKRYGDGMNNYFIPDINVVKKVWPNAVELNYSMQEIFNPVTKDTQIMFIHEMGDWIGSCSILAYILVDFYDLTIDLILEIAENSPVNRTEILELVGMNENLTEEVELWRKLQ